MLTFCDIFEHKTDNVSLFYAGVRLFNNLSCCKRSPNYFRFWCLLVTRTSPAECCCVDDSVGRVRVRLMTLSSTSLILPTFMFLTSVNLVSVLLSSSSLLARCLCLCVVG